MKKFLKITLILFFFIIVALISIPLLFKAEIMKKAKQEINKSLYATVDWKDFSVSLISGFPNLKVSLKDMSVVGINKFEGDTLMAFDEFSVKINLISIFSGKIKVKSILLDKPLVNAIALADSSVNWDIAVPSDAQEEVEEIADTSSLGMSVELKSFEIRDARINYMDSLSNMFAGISGFNLKLKGDLSADYSDLDFSTDIAALTFTMDGLSYLKNASLSIRSLIGADLAKSNFTFSENEIRLNDLKLGVEGSFGMPNDTDITTDLRFFAKETEFKSVLSMVPAVYMQDFEGVKTSGSFSIDGTAKGVYNEKLMPRINVVLNVKDGSFSYPDLPKSANNINVDSKLFFDGVNQDSTKLDINKFHIEMAGNPFDMQLHIITPMSDMQMNGAAKGRIDLGSVADVVPVPDTRMEGLINVDLDFMGKMSDIEKENYEAFKADGLLEVLGVEVESKSIPAPVAVSKLTMNFSPKYVNLQTFDAKIGNSDIHMDGALENFIPFVFKNEVIKGRLNLNSNYLNISELMPESPGETEVEPEDTFALSVIEVPKNINFILQTDIDKLLYDKLELEEINGKVTIQDGKVLMEKLSMNLLGGSMIMSGEYNTQNIKSPLVNYKLDMKEIDIPSAFRSFNTVARLAPIAEMMMGKITTKLDFSSLLDSSMIPVLGSIIGNGNFLAEAVEIKNSETFNRISLALKNENFKDVSLRNIKTFFEIRDGRVILQPFDAKIGSYNVTIGGDQGIDQTMNYSMVFGIPRSEFGSAANDVYQNLVSQAASKGFDLKQSENVNINLKIAGTFSDPKIGLEVAESLTQAKTQVKEAIRDKVTDEVQKVREDVSEKTNAEIDRIMKEAEEQAASIKAGAKEAGEKLVGEAELQGKNLIKEAGSNPLKKTLAEKTAAELVKKANQKAETLNKEAEDKANAVLEAAKKKADALKQN